MLSPVSFLVGAFLGLMLSMVFVVSVGLSGGVVASSGLGGGLSSSVPFPPRASYVLGVSFCPVVLFLAVAWPMTSVFLALWGTLKYQVMLGVTA